MLSEVLPLEPVVPDTIDAEPLAIGHSRDAADNSDQSTVPPFSDGPRLPGR